MEQPDFQGEALNKKQAKRVETTADYWRKVGDEATVQAVARIEEAAKQLISLTGALQGLYFAVYTFGDLRESLDNLSLPIPNWLILLVFLSPALLWLISMYCATRVFVPQVRGANLNDTSEDAWKNTKQVYEETRDQKLRWLHRSHTYLMVSFVLVLIVLVALANLPSAPASAPAHVIPLTPTPPVLSTATP